MDIQQEILAAFQVEHKEQVEALRSLLVSLREQNTAPNDPRWDEAFRIAHTLKGGARVCDLRGIESLGHRMESLFSCVREGTLAFDGGVADTLYRVLDEIEDSMVTLMSGSVPPTVTTTLDLLERILEGAKRNSAPVTNPQLCGAHTEADTSPTAIIDRDSVRPGTGDNPTAPGTSPESETLRVQTQHLDTLLRSTDALYEMNAEQVRVGRETMIMCTQLRELQRQCERLTAKGAPIVRRLGAAREVSDLVSEIEGLTLTARRVARQSRAVRTLQRGAAWSAQIVSEELRRAAHHTRMVSAENVFQSLRTMVRNLARDEGKEVEFRAVGLSTRADRMVLQSLKDPLLHALRNAIVHGIEPPEERIGSGKARVGQVSLSLSIRGNRLRVLIEDDGRGIDLARVARTAVQRGYLAVNEPETVNEDELRRVLFRPGFSTNSEVTELAGRGMGLSVVHETVARLRGSSRIGPREGHGTVLELMLPLLVSTERLLLVSCDSAVFALPTHSIDRLVRVRAKDLQTVDGRRIALTEGGPLSLVALTGITHAAPSTSKEDMLSVVALRAGTAHIGLVVDAFLSEREALIKSLEGSAARVKPFCGAIVLDDGDVALVVDPHALAEMDESIIGPGRSAPAATAPAALPVVLVVDDSFTTRTLEKSILEANGYQVRIAVDGLEALRVLRTEPIGIVVADVQMPRMDGLSLLTEIRADERLESLPVILVTSLDRPQDFARGMELGANAYIVKRKFDHQELLATIERFGGRTTAGAARVAGAPR